MFMRGLVSLFLQSKLQEGNSEIGYITNTKYRIYNQSL